MNKLSGCMLDKILSTIVSIKTNNTIMVFKIEQYRPENTTIMDLPLDHQLYMEEKFYYLVCIEDNLVEIIKEIVDTRDRSFDTELSKDVQFHIKQYLVLYRSYLYAWSMWKKSVIKHQKKPSLDTTQLADRRKTALNMYDQICNYRDYINTLTDISMKIIMKKYGLPYI